MHLYHKVHKYCPHFNINSIFHTHMNSFTLDMAPRADVQGGAGPCWYSEPHYGKCFELLAFYQSLKKLIHIF